MFKVDSSCLHVASGSPPSVISSVLLYSPDRGLLPHPCFDATLTYLPCVLHTPAPTLSDASHIPIRSAWGSHFLQTCPRCCWVMWAQTMRASRTPLNLGSWTFPPFYYGDSQRFEQRTSQHNSIAIMTIILPPLSSLSSYLKTSALEKTSKITRLKAPCAPLPAWNVLHPPPVIEISHLPGQFTNFTSFRSFP